MTTNEPAATRTCDTRDAIQQALAVLADAASRHVVVFAPALDDALWSSTSVLDTMRRFLTERSQREWRVLVETAEGLASEHPALVALVQRLPSLLQVRKADPDAAMPARQAFIASDSGMLLLFHADQRPGAVFTADDPGRARKLADAHGQAWERAQPLGELRQLGW